MATTLVVFFFVCLAALVTLALVVKIFHYVQGKKFQKFGQCGPKTITIAFFHPYCNGGGGGERVLWKAITAINRLHKEGAWKFHITIYSDEVPAGETGSPGQQVLEKADKLFGIGLSNLEVEVKFVFLKMSNLLEASRYPFFTLLGQSLGGGRAAWAALRATGAPRLFFDTTGCPLALPVARWLFGSHTAAYVHYPTISTDMLKTVAPTRRKGNAHAPSLVHNRRKWISNSIFFSSIKYIYYLCCALLYGACGLACSLALCNSSWTAAHLRALWRRRVPVVHPPCDAEGLKDFPIDGRQQVIVSVGQFRPEKDHLLQVKIMALLKEQYATEKRIQDAKLVMIGGCRNKEDEERVVRIKTFAAELGVSDRVEVLTNLPYPELRAWLGRAAVGLHTMWAEHFGICVVEYQAAGLFCAAHRSGGPEADIVVPHHGQPTGALAATAEEYAAAVAGALRAPDHRADVRRAGRAAAGRFSDAAFEEGLLGALAAFLRRL